MSHQASGWAWSVTVGHPNAKSVLAAIADHADPDGRHAWPSKETIAHKVECSVKTVRRSVAYLIAEGWIREGDQQQVAHLRGDRRPIVYDLAMNEPTRLAWKAAAAAPTDSEERGDNLSPRSLEATPDTGGQPVPSQNGHGGTPTTGREDATGGHLGPHGGTPTTPKQSKNQLPPHPPASGGRPATCPKHPDDPGANCRACGTTPRQIAEQRRRDAEAEARAAERIRIDQERAEREAARTAGRSPAAEQLLAQTRRQLAGSRR